MDDSEDLERLIRRMREAGHAYEWEELADHQRRYCMTRAGVACSTCRGAGQTSYSSTSGWRGGVGGQTFTVGVCDRCWGTGRSDRQGANLRRLASEMEAARRATFEDHLIRRIGRARMGDLSIIADKLDRCRWQTRDTMLMHTVRLLADVLREAAAQSDP